MTQSDIASPTVLLTGPTRGIGRAMLQRLIGHPARPDLILLARDPAALGEAVSSARAAGLTAHAIPLDLADLVSCAKPPRPSRPSCAPVAPGRSTRRSSTPEGSSSTAVTSAARATS